MTDALVGNLGMIAPAREAGAPYLAVYEAAMQAYRERKKEE